jgi:hypothetical protein
MIAAVRQTVTSLSYFHHARPEHEMPKQDDSQN